MNNMKGFTLLEILIATSIFLMLTAVALSLMLTSNEAWFTGSTSIGLRQEIIKTLLTMEKELKETRASQTNLSIGSTSSSLSFKIPKITNGSILDSSGNIIWSNGIAYSLNANKQIIRNDSVTTTVLGNNVTALNFTRPTAMGNILQINITAQKTSPTRRVFHDTELMSIRMRN